MQNKSDLNQIQALVIDMDGVLWLGDMALPGLQEFFSFLDQNSIPYIAATNNASRTVAQYEQKFARLGVSIAPERILTSSLATTSYLQTQLPSQSKVYIIGQDGIHHDMQQAGFVITEDAGQPVEAVVVAIDRGLTYEKLKYATLLIRRGARFIATNGDLTFPAEDGIHPGAGAILAALTAATSVEPTVIGKPEPWMFQIATHKMNSTPERTAMIGDRLETDILGGQRAGLRTILVTSGVDNRDAIAHKGIEPDMICSGIAELTQQWQSQRAAGDL